MKQIFLLTTFFVLFLIPCFAQENISCPDIKVVPLNKTYMLGVPIPFSISSDEGLKNLKLEYKWKTSEGIIEKGQGTSAILISTGGLADSSIIATVEIKGLPQNCPNTFSGTAILPKPPKARLIIDYIDPSDLPYPDDIKRRVSDFYTELNNQPTARGIITIYGTNKEIAKRKAEIKRIIKLGKYDIRRVESVSSVGNTGKISDSQIRTVFYIVPKGEKTPTP